MLNIKPWAEEESFRSHGCDSVLELVHGEVRIGLQLSALSVLLLVSVLHYELVLLRLQVHDTPFGFLTPGSFDQEDNKGEEEEANHCDDSCEPLRE